MSDLVLIADKEMKRLQNDPIDELVDWQFNLMQDLIDVSNDIIHREYKDDHILQQGMIMLRYMILLHMVNRTIVKRFPDSKMAELIQEQFTQSTRPVPDLISDEIEQLTKHFDEIKETLMVDFDNIKRRVDGMDTVNRIATLNLREYEDTLRRVFQKPMKV